MFYATFFIIFYILKSPVCVVTPVLSARHCHGVCCKRVSFRVSEVLITNLHCCSNFCYSTAFISIQVEKVLNVALRTCL